MFMKNNKSINSIKLFKTLNRNRPLISTFKNSQNIAHKQLNILTKKNFKCFFERKKFGVEKIKKIKELKAHFSEYKNKMSYDIIDKYWGKEGSKERPNELKFDLNPEEITKLTEEIIRFSKNVQDEVANEKNPTFQNTVKKLEDTNGFLYAIVQSCCFPQHVSTDKTIREASSESEKKLDAFDIESNMREDVYATLAKYRDQKEKLDSIDQKLLEKTLEDYERNGLGLPKEKREKLKEMKTKISELCNKFQQNLNEDTTKLTFTEKDLEGCTKDFLAGLKKDENGNYIVSLKYPEMFPVLQYAKNSETRKKLYLAYAEHCNKENIPILEEVVALRDECAKLMGYETHADYILEIRMAKSRTNVVDFLTGLHQKLKPAALEDLKAFLEYKKKEEDPNATIIQPWDFRYYLRLRLEKEYGVDDDFIKDFFPLEVVTKGVLEVYQKILSLKFEREEKPHVWHEDVESYKVYDKDTNKFIGHFYLDLFPREGKYGHAAAFPLQKIYKKESGEENAIAAAMVANFTKPTKDKPSLLQFSEVETYFHEFGHVFHNLCSTSRYCRFSGTSVERDFVEAPSQMLENWCYETEVLNMLSGHYQDHNKKLPSDVIEKIKATKNCGVGILTCRQLFFGIFDQTIHSQSKSDTAAIWKKLTGEVFMVQDDTQFGNPAASFGHLVGGYDAQYYGYLYSEVFSDDMYTKFKDSKDGVLSEEVGKKYRDIILAPGGTRDSYESLKLFLEREPNQIAFLKNKGLQVSNL